MLILEELIDCGPSWFLKILLFIKEILNILSIGIPISLIVLMIVDMSKAVISSDSEKMAKSAKIAFSRLKYAVIVFAVPWIVSTIMNLLGFLGAENTYCLNITSEQINALEKNEEEEAKKLYEEMKQKIEDNNNNNNDDNNSNETEEIDYITINKKGCDGVVYFENNTFYIPNYSDIPAGKEGTQGSATSNYNKSFYELLQGLIDAGKKAGYTITASNTLFGSWRPYEIQAYFYCCSSGNGATYEIPEKYRVGNYKNYPPCTGKGSCNNGSFASEPGKSYHGYGIASDLGGTKAAKDWAKDNAHKFYLVFGNPNEDWHIQAANVIQGDNHGCTKKVNK